MKNDENKKTRDMVWAVMIVVVLTAILSIGTTVLWAKDIEKKLDNGDGKWLKTFEKFAEAKCAAVGMDFIYVTQGNYIRCENSDVTAGKFYEPSYALVQEYKVVNKTVYWYDGNGTLVETFPDNR